MKKYKKVGALLVLAALCGGTKLQAQWYVGVEGGANRNYFVTNVADKPFFDYQSSYGYSFGLPVRYQVASLPWFGGIQATPSYVQKNYKMQRTGFYSEMYQQNTNTYLELPLMAQFRFGGNVGKQQSLYGTLNLGGFGGYWLSGHVKGRTLSPMDLENYQAFDEAYAFNETKDNRFEWGALAGIGLQYMPNRNYVISLEGRYTPTLSDQQKLYSEDQTPRYNDTYSLQLGVQYQLKAIRLKKHSSKK